MSVVPVELPQICCRCAQKPGTSIWTIVGSRFPGINFVMVALGVKQAGYPLQVPVCKDCFEILRWLEIRNRRVNYLLITLSFLLRVYILLQTHILLMSVLVSLLFYGVFSLLLKSREPRKLGGCAGPYFWFSEGEFFKQFAQLNPTLVNPNQYRRFFDT
jgi:hypothetical protein